MAGGAQATPGQGQQPDPLQPPSIKRTLLSMIPVAGPLLAQHSLLNLELKRRREDQQIQAKQAPFALATQFANNEALDPDTRLQWQQLQADMAIHNEENPTRAYTPDIIKRHQALLGNTTQQIALKQSRDAQNVPSALQPSQQAAVPQNASPLINPQGGFNLTPPPGAPVPPPGAASGMLPQGASQVGVGPGRPPVQSQPIAAPVPPSGQPPAQPDPVMESLNPLLQNPNPLISSPAKNALNAIQLGKAQMAAKIAGVTQQLKAAGQDPADLPVEAWMDLLGKGEIRPLNPLKPGEQQPSVSGSIIAQNTLPRFETAPQGATPFLLTPPPGGSTQSAAAPQSAAPPSTGADISTGLPPGVTQLQGPPAQLTPDEAKLLSAAQQVAQKHGIPFDPTKNPRNPFAQIPTRYQAEVNALDAEQKADPAMRQQMMALRSMQESNIAFQQDQARLRRVDQSYNKSTSDLDKYGKPIDDGIARFARLRDTINQKSAQADSLIAPELLTVMAGGMGSGLRMNEAEIARVVGGRDKWESLKAKINQWKPGGGLSVTDSQRDQINKLVKVVYQKLQQKRATLDDALDKLRNSEDVKEHRGIVSDARKSLTAIDEGNAPGGPLTPPPGGGASAGDMVQVKLKDGRIGPVHRTRLQEFLNKNPGSSEVKQ